MDLVPEEDVEKLDSRNSKKPFLETDGICLSCGTVINTYWEDSCLICKGRSIISGMVGVNLRLLLAMDIGQLEAIAEIRGINRSSKYKMVLGLLKVLYPDIGIGEYGKYKKLNRSLIRKIYTRNIRKFFYITQIDDIVEKEKNKYQTKEIYRPNIKLVNKEDMKESV